MRMSRSLVRALIIDSLIVGGWLVCVGMVVLHERGGLWRGFGNPTASLGATLDVKEQWFGIYYQGQKIGFSQTILVPEEHDGMPGVGVMDRGRLSFNLLGSPQQLEVSARAFIDADWRLQFFTTSIHTATHDLTFTGRRHGDELLVSMTTPTSSVAKRLQDPTGGAFVNGLSSWVAFHRLRVGQSGKAWVLNPLALNPEPVYFTVRRSEALDGKQALVVESDVGGMTTTSWVTPEGEVLKETSPLGWELRQEPRGQALQPPQTRSAALDLLSTTSVSVDRPIAHPERITRLTLLLEGVAGETLTIQRPWQHVLPTEQVPVEARRPTPQAPWCVVELHRPSLGQASPSLPTAVERYQRPTLFVQSDDARILAKAAEIVKGKTEAWERVVALNQWVYTTMTKRLTVGLPSAIDILETPIGDCHEHTVLFTALARSLKLPTRMVAGLVYWDGRLYYHAWPEVWLGEWSPHLSGSAFGGPRQVGGWIPTDPTLGQPLADATHLGLIEAENEELMSLAQFVTKLRVHVLELVERPPGGGRTSHEDVLQGALPSGLSAPPSSNGRDQLR